MKLQLDNVEFVEARPFHDITWHHEILRCIRHPEKYCHSDILRRKIIVERLSSACLVIAIPFVIPDDSR